MERRDFLKAAAAGAAVFSVQGAQATASRPRDDGKVDLRLAPPCGLYCGLCDPRECHGCGCACGQCAGKAHQKACEIAPCALRRNVTSCGDCPDFACTKLIQFANHPVWRTHLPVIENLRRRKAIGTERWLREQKEYWSDEKHLKVWMALTAECDSKYDEFKGASKPSASATQPISDSLIAPCGLDCSKCEIYKAARDPQAAQKLAKAWRQAGHPDARPDWFRCQGCRGDKSLRWTGDCRIAACCTERKNLASCSLCDEFPCPSLQEWAAKTPGHKAAFARLQQMRRAKPGVAG